MENNKIYEMVTERIITQLEKGIIPWDPHFVKVVDQHINLKTKKPYSFINQILLSIDEGHEVNSLADLTSNVWATFKQWKEIGGSVRKGEKSHIVLSWMVKEVPTGKRVQLDDGEWEDVIETVIRPVYYNVFSLDQVDGVDRDKIMGELPNVNDTIEDAQDVLDQYWSRENINVIIQESNKAYYSPANDTILLRALNQYDSSEHFYRTAFHESVHSTGHKSRLDRFEDEKAAAFGGEVYSKEELTAELGSAFLMAITGIETEATQEQNAAYIQGWLSVLKDDPKMIVQAAARAEKAVTFILNGYEPKASEPVNDSEDVNVTVEPATEEVAAPQSEAQVYALAYKNYDSMYSDNVVDINYETGAGNHGRMTVNIDQLTNQKEFKQLLSIIELDYIHCDGLVAHVRAYLKRTVGFYYMSAALSPDEKLHVRNMKEAERYKRMIKALGLC